MVADKVIVRDDSFAEKACPFRFAMQDPKCQAERCAMWTFYHMQNKIIGCCSLTRKV